MKFHTTTEKPNYHIGCGEEALKTYWGTMPIPANSKAIGVYTDSSRVGVYFELENGNALCGNCGSVSRVQNVLEYYYGA